MTPLIGSFPRPSASLPDASLLLWGTPICLTAHNLEEALGVSELVKLLRRFFPWFRFSAGQFLAALVVVTVGVWIGALVLPEAERLIFLLAVQAILFFNAFVPHLLLSFRLRRYTPGVATAALLVIPYSALLFAQVWPA